MRFYGSLVLVIAIGACHASRSKPGQPPPAAGSRFLFAWAGDADKRDSDFLAVIDVDPRSATYASVVEFDPAGRTVRSVRAAVPAIDSAIRPYSLAVLPGIDRVVTTATDMHLEVRSRAVQVWRLSDLTLLQTILLPPAPDRDASWMTAEPRVLSDGRTVIVNTFTCGLYRLHGLAGDSATAEWVYSTPWREPPYCAVPVVVGHFWLQTSGPEHAILSLDLSDPGKPREVSRLTLGPNEVPHWLALEPTGDRVVITGYQALESRLLLAHVDRATGALRPDTTFKAPGATQLGVDFASEQWPHGTTGRAIPHGAVFSRQ